jgi:deoxyribonuclease V
VWPRTGVDLQRVQTELAALEAEAWRPTPEVSIGAVWFAAPKGSPGDRAGEPAWASAVTVRAGAVVDDVVVRGRTAAAYRPGLLALREGPLLEAALGRLQARPDLVLVNATARDHPRGAGLALHLGIALDLPTIGITDRPLLAVPRGEPGEARGERVACDLGGVEVAILLRTRAGARPLVVHPAWRTDHDVAAAVVLSVTGASRTPDPLRRARTAARLARARDAGRLR